MKKLIFGIGAAIVAVIIYYFAVGSSQIADKLKSQVNQQLVMLEQKGFVIKDRKSDSKTEHFVIVFEDTDKISDFLYHKGIQIAKEDAKTLKGLKLGVDSYYLPDTYSLVSFDMYPVALPDILMKNNNKKFSDIIQKLLDKKAILMHLAINKTISKFKGYIADINETLYDDKSVNLLLKNFHFSGDIVKDAIYRVKQNLDKFALHFNNETEVSLSNINSDYKVTGDTVFDYNTHYNISDILINLQSSFKVIVKNTNIHSDSSVKKDIASGAIKTTIENIHIEDNQEPYNLENFALEIKASNIDVKAIDAMQKTDMSDEKSVNKILKQLLSKGVHFEIANLSLESMENPEQKIDGFILSAKVELDKNLNFDMMQNNPVYALNNTYANLKLEFSKELYEIVLQQPQIMMALMMFPPKDKNSTKTYSLELKDGNLTINGQPIM